MKAKEIGLIILFVVVCQMAGIIGSVFTFDAIPGWYSTLERPDFAPPNWVFGPVWISLYTIMGISAYLIYRKGLGENGVKMALSVFGLQLGLNALWSILFFGLRSPLLGLICILALLSSIIATIVLFSRHSKAAALLLIPYVLWVSFATLLNYYILILN